MKRKYKSIRYKGNIVTNKTGICLTGQAPRKEERIILVLQLTLFTSWQQFNRSESLHEFVIIILPSLASYSNKRSQSEMVTEITYSEVLYCISQKLKQQLITEAEEVHKYNTLVPKNIGERQFKRVRDFLNDKRSQLLCLESKGLSVTEQIAQIKIVKLLYGENLVENFSLFHSDDDRKKLVYSVFEHLELRQSLFDAIERGIKSFERTEKCGEVLIDCEFKDFNEYLTLFYNQLYLLSQLLLNAKAESDFILKWFPGGKYLECLKLINDLRQFHSIGVRDQNLSLRQPHYTKINLKPFHFALLKKLDSLTCLCSILLLGITTTKESFIDLSSPIIIDSKTLEDVEGFFTKSCDSINPVVVYMWSFINYTVSLIKQDQKMSEEETFYQEMAAFYATKAEDYDVLHCLIKISESLDSQETFGQVVLSSFILLLINFVPINETMASLIATILEKSPSNFKELFLINETLNQKINNIKVMLPLINKAMVPLLKISSLNSYFADSIWHILRCYTTNYKLTSDDYDLSEESASPESIVLKKAILVASPLESNSNVKISIPQNTSGRIIATSSQDPNIIRIDDSKEDTLKSIVSGRNSINTDIVHSESDDDCTNLITFIHTYEGWPLLGRILQSIGEQYFIKNLDSAQGSDQYLLLDLVHLISRIVSDETSLDVSSRVLKELSLHLSLSESLLVEYRSDNSLSEDYTILYFIFKLFDRALHLRHYELITAFLHLMNNLAMQYPDLAWLYLKKSDLLDKNGKTGLANTILGTLELHDGRYEFTTRLSKLAHTLCQSSMTVTKTSIRTRQDILYRMICHLVHVFESHEHWRFNNINQRFELEHSLITLFVSILGKVYGIDSQTDPNDKVTRVLYPAGEYIMNAFLCTGLLEPYAANILIDLSLSYADLNISFCSDNFAGELYECLVRSSFAMINMLLSIRNTQHMKPSPLEHNLFKKSIDYVKIYNEKSYERWKKEIIQLISHLIDMPRDSSDHNYPYLLSYLGDDHAKTFAQTLVTDLSADLTENYLIREIYVLFNTSMRSKQDGLSILFLTGRIAANNVNKDHKSERINSESSVLAVLRKHAKEIGKIDDYLAYHLLEALCSAFNMWANARNLPDDREIIRSLSDELINFAVPDSTGEFQSDTMLELSCKYNVVSKILEVFALYLFTANDSHVAIIELLNNNDFSQLIEPYFRISDDQSIFDDEIDSEFARTWPHLKVENFINSFTTYDLSSNSTTYFQIFDFDLMDLILGKNEVWTNNIRERIIKRSINMGYITNRIAAAKAWGALLTSYVKTQHNTLNDSFVNLASYFLDLNINHENSKWICQRILFNERIELIFYIFFSFHKTDKIIPDKKLAEFLSKLLSVFKSDEVSFLAEISRYQTKKLYRPILRVVLMILSLSHHKSQFVELVAEELLQFFELAFCNGVQIILSEMLLDIHSFTSNGKEVVLPNLDESLQDLFLLLAFFRRIKDMKPTNYFNMSMANALSDKGTLRSIFNIYSSSHMVKLNDEPILGEIALTFISELSSIDVIAESFIQNGLFTVMLESPLSTLIQQGNLRPEVTPKLHQLWSNGILSINILILSQFGNRVLSETCLLISFFSKQVKTCILSWSDLELRITSALVRETTQLILLQKMLGALNYKEHIQKSVVGQRNSDVQLITGLDNDSDRKELELALKKLLTHPKYLNSRIIASTLEEQQILEDEKARSKFVKKLSDDIKEMQSSLSQVDAL